MVDLRRLTPMTCSMTFFPRSLKSVFLLMLVVSSFASNAMTLRQLRALEAASKQGEDYANYYLVGVMEGTIEAHAQALRQGGKPSICLNGRRLEPRMARGLFDGELRRNAGVYEADMPVQLVMTNALVSAYPCQ
jgi:hypothetical protein